MDGTQRVEGWTAAFRDRFGDLIQAAGGIQAVIDATGWSEDKLANWRSGRTRLPLHEAAVLCRLGNRSVDWLAFGAASEDSQRLDPREVEAGFRSWATVMRHLDPMPDVEDMVTAYMKDVSSRSLKSTR